LSWTLRRLRFSSICSDFHLYENELFDGPIDLLYAHHFRIHPTMDICLSNESVGVSRSFLLGPQDIRARFRRRGDMHGRRLGLTAGQDPNTLDG
jgi:hypothetical protein